MPISTEKKTYNQMELVDKLVPQLLKKVGISLKLIRQYYLTSKLQHHDLAREALWLATCESDDEAVVIRKASSLMVKWMKEDIQPELAEKLRERAKNHRGPADDSFSLPWGQRVSESVIHSGEKGPLAIAIDPTPTDAELLEQDTTNYLLKILKYTLEYWGPHAVAWLVLCMGNKYSAAMRTLGAKVDLSLVKQAMRGIKTIRADIQNNFHSMRI